MSESIGRKFGFEIITDPAGSIIMEEVLFLRQGGVMGCATRKYLMKPLK